MNFEKIVLNIKKINFKIKKSKAWKKKIKNDNPVIIFKYMKFKKFLNFGIFSFLLKPNNKK